MHDDTVGYVFPVASWLARAEHGGDKHPCFRSTRDSVGKLLRQQGFRTCRSFRGDLPLGYGFAGSTVLAWLHLAGQVSADDTTRLASMTDRAVHGFPPSGVDAQATLRQRPGLYLRGCWQDAPELEFGHLFCLVRRGTPRQLGHTRAALLAARSTLVPSAARLTSALLGSGELDRGELRSYALAVAACDVYTDQQRALIEPALAAGLIAKGIGGLYDKAVLLAGRPSEVAATVRACSEVTAVSRFETSTWPGASRRSTWSGPRACPDGRGGERVG